MSKLTQLESIGVKFSALLHSVGIDDQQQLLAACKQRTNLESLALQTGINQKLIRKWATHADLARINGVGDEYACLLEQSGIDSVQSLAQWESNGLLQAMHSINEQHKLVQQLPGSVQIENWINDAKKLDPVIYP